jgi:diguanylate cyclase (GGDEF)-like protein
MVGMSLRQKLMAVLAIPAVVLVVATALAYQASVRRSQGTDQIARTYRIMNEIEATLAQLQAAESDIRGYLITGDPGMVHPYDRSRADLVENMDQIDKLIRDDTAARLAETLTTHVMRRIEVLDHMAHRAESGTLVPREGIKYLTKQGEVSMQNVLGFAEELRAREDELLEIRTAALNDAEDASFLIRMVGLPGGLIAAGVIVAVFAGRLLKRIGSLSENTRRLEQGLPLIDSSTHRDELGELERTFVQTGTKVIELQGELQRLATLDPLTGLANRRGFLETAEHRLDLARRQGTTLALLFVDADGLKRVNDMLGHAAGDELLQEIGALLRDTFRASDLPARLGGDEFCVLVSADNIAGVDVARTRLSEAIAMANRLPGREYELAISMGIAVFDRDHDRSVDDLIARADALMYQEKHAKRQGGEGPIAPASLPPGDATPSHDRLDATPSAPRTEVDAPAPL